MKLAERIIDSIEELSFWVSSMAKQSLPDMISLETADSKYTLVNKNGSLLSVLRLEGSRQVVGKKEFAEIVNGVDKGLESYLSQGGHQVQFYFQHDKEMIRRSLTEHYAPSVRAADNMGFSIEDIVADRISAMEKHCHTESCYLVLMTLPSAISKAELKRSSEKADAAYKKRNGAYSPLAQNPIIAIDGLRDRHNSFVHSLETDLREVGLLATKLNAHEACREIRMSIDADFTDQTWEPSLPGDKLPMRIPASQRDISGILWPKLSYQLAPRGGISYTPQFFAIGNRVYATITIDLAPKTPKPFNVLFRRLTNAQIPWRINMNVGSGGLQYMSMKNTMSAILGAFHADNSLIRESYNELRDQVRAGQTMDVKLSVTLTTWVNGGRAEMGKLSSYASSLARAVEGWGICDVNEVPGDSAEGFMSSVLAHDGHGIAPWTAAPLDEVVLMTPLARPASPWATGSLLFRTPDGKIFPYQPGSSKQDAWIDLIFAPMGAGKSVLMNSLNLALCADPRVKRLPRIAIIDIGTSSEGLILLLKDGLPEGRKHEAAYHRLRMVPECAINPFDTSLGCRHPISSHRTFLSNFLLILATPVGETKPYDGISDMVGVVIEETYKRLSDKNSPKPYVPGQDLVVDEAISRTDITLDEDTTWWEVVDGLFKHRMTHEAGMAQRYAMPILDDLIETARSEVVRDLFKVTTATNEPIAEAFIRMISSSVREYPIISRPTKFDLAEARVISLDLDEVAKEGGEKAQRQTAVMYMLARFVLAKDFYITEATVKEMESSYQDYHTIRAKETAEDIKRLCIDEFHRTRKTPLVREQIVTDIREGRKWGVHICLASQNMDDYDSLMISLSTSLFVMGKQDSRDVKNICERFGLGSTEEHALIETTHGPRPGVGTTFLLSTSTNDYSKRTSQVVTSTIGPTEYWAFSTTQEDRIIRGMAYAKLNGNMARKLLVESYPWGIKKEVERRALVHEDTQFDEKAKSGLIETIFNEMVLTSKLIAESRSEKAAGEVA